MSNYSLLLNFKIEHEYFANSRCTAFSCEPDANTVNVSNNHSLVIQTHADGVSVYFDQDSTEALLHSLSDDSAPFVLWFRLFPADPEMSTYTVPSTPQEKKVLVFSDDNKNIDEETGRQFLTLEDSVSDGDFITRPVYDPKEKDQDKIDLFNAITPGDLRVPPVAFVRIGVTDRKARQYLIRFKSRETFWKYYLLGELAKPTNTIVDTQETVAFGKGVDTILPGDRRAIMFTSSEKIPMRQFSDKHFELRSSQIGVLIMRLPVASKNRLYTDKINGQKELVSDIYIND